MTVSAVPETPPAARINLQGRVTDAATGQPVAGAQVFIEALSLGAVTGDDGRYLLMDVPDGSHELTLEHRRYYTVRVDVAVRPDAVGPARVNVGLPLTPYTGTPGYSESLGGCRRPEAPGDRGSLSP